MRVYRTTKIVKQTGAVMWKRLSDSRRQFSSAVADGGSWRYRITLEVIELDESALTLIEDTGVAKP